MPIENFQIIVPAHNEAKQINQCIETLELLYPQATITIATDGNSDGTAEIALEQALQHPNIFVQSFPFRIGKGAAIKEAILTDLTNVFIDADLAVNPYAITPLVKIAQTTNGLAIAQRILQNRNKKRTILSNIYNNLIQLFFHTKIKDHQCGCKALSPKASAIALTVEANDFFFDTELIIKCKQVNIPITEYPVSWTEYKTKSTVNTTKDSWKMLKQLIQLRLK